MLIWTCSFFADLLDSFHDEYATGYRLLSPIEMKLGLHEATARCMAQDIVPKYPNGGDPSIFIAIRATTIGSMRKGIVQKEQREQWPSVNSPGDAWPPSKLGRRRTIYGNFGPCRPRFPLSSTGPRFTLRIEGLEPSCRAYLAGIARPIIS
ncbi:hypothetical protein QCA50_013112 [Cerrena zonata]|uniref:Uncharacterized protein n=1 Tax=Cerrena zonata TaxID=2478898 RepID=A0AAW0FSH2_9APHY